MKNIILYSLLTALAISVLTTVSLAFGQTNSTSEVVQDVQQLEDQSGFNNTINAALGTVITGVGGYITAKTYKDRKDKGKIEQYASESDKIIFGHVMDNYNDFASYAKIRVAYIDLVYQNPDKSEFQLLNTIADQVTNETYGQIEKKFLKQILKWNSEYYGHPSNDPTITCPDPKNPIARTMTDIKKYSVPTIKTEIE